MESVSVCRNIIRKGEKKKQISFNGKRDDFDSMIRNNYFVDSHHTKVKLHFFLSLSLDSLRRVHQGI